MRMLKESMKNNLCLPTGGCNKCLTLTSLTSTPGECCIYNRMVQTCDFFIFYLPNTHKHFYFYTEQQWKVTNDSHTLNKGALLVLSEQRTAVTSAFIFVMYILMCRYYRKWYSSWMKSWQPFINQHQLFSLVSMGNRKVVVLPENWSLAFSIWWNNRNHFDGIFMEYLSGIQSHVYFWK